jgi:hypothetical protein
MRNQYKRYDKSHKKVLVAKGEAHLVKEERVDPEDGLRSLHLSEVGLFDLFFFLAHLLL